MSSQPVLTFVLTVKGAINVAFGAGLVVAPAPLLHLYGVLLDPAAALLARLLGAACFGLGLVQLIGRNSLRSDLQSLLVAACAIADLIGFTLCTLAMRDGTMNALGWGVVVIYAFAGFGFAFAWLRECRHRLPHHQHVSVESDTQLL